METCVVNKCFTTEPPTVLVSQELAQFPHKQVYEEGTFCEQSAFSEVKTAQA